MGKCWSYHPVSKSHFCQKVDIAQTLCCQPPLCNNDEISLNDRKWFLLNIAVETQTLLEFITHSKTFNWNLQIKPEVLFSDSDGAHVRLSVCSDLVAACVQAGECDFQLLQG